MQTPAGKTVTVWVKGDDTADGLKAKVQVGSPTACLDAVAVATDGCAVPHLRVLPAPSAPLSALSGTAVTLTTFAQERVGIPPSEQRLVAKGKQLQGSRTLASYGVSQHTHVEVHLQLSGGGAADGG